MKKLIIAAAILGCGLLSSCGLGTADNTTATSTATSQDANGSILGSLLGGSNSGDVLSNIIGTMTGNLTTNQSTLVGTWNYSAPCVQFESESLLAKAGGAVVSTKVENTLNTYYQKVGIKAGACSFVFGSDNTLKMIIGSKTYTGTYTFNSSNNTVTMTGQFGNNLTAYVSISGSTMGLTFDASKLLTLLTKASSLSSKTSTISSIASQYSGMKAGFKFTK